MPEFLYIVQPIRPTFPGDGTAEEFAVIGEHFDYLKLKLANGELILVGRTQDASPLGICVFEAPDESGAQKFLDEDPAVAKGIFSGQVRPYHVALLRGRD